MILDRLNPFKRDNSDRINFENALITTAVAGDTGKHSDAASEYIEMTNRMGYMVMDEIVIKAIAENEFLHPLLFFISQLNATINLDKHQAELKRIRWEKIITMFRLTMPVEMYENNGYETLSLIRLFGHDRISEAVNGWKGHLVTEQSRKLEIKTPQEKKGRF